MFNYIKTNSMINSIKVKGFGLSIVLLSLGTQVFAIGAKQPVNETSHLDTVKPLKIGDKVPDIVFNEMLNYHVPSARLSDFKGKLVILDFWNTGCTGCIQAFPKAHRLQKEFNDEIQIITVGKQGADYPHTLIKPFMERKKGTKYALELPTAVMELNNQAAKEVFTYMVAAFQISGFPQLVWIDKYGIYRANTRGEYLSSDCINAVLRDTDSQLPFSPAMRPQSFDELEFLIKTGNGRETFGSAFSRYIDTLGSYNLLGIRKTNKTDNWRVYCVNRPVIDCYKMIYQDSIEGLLGDYGNRNVIIESSRPDDFYKGTIDKRPLLGFDYHAFEKKYHYSYELILSGETSKNEVFTRLVEDFDRFFHIKSGIETRSMKCLALVISEDKSKIVTARKAENPTSGYSNDYEDMFMKNWSINQVIGILEGRLPSFKIIDDTGFKGKIDISIPSSFFNDDIADLDSKEFASLRARLLSFGLDLKVVNRSMPVLVLKDTRNPKK